MTAATDGRQPIAWSVDYVRYVHRMSDLTDCLPVTLPDELLAWSFDSIVKEQCPKLTPTSADCLICDDQFLTFIEFKSWINPQYSSERDFRDREIIRKLQLKAAESAYLFERCLKQDFPQKKLRLWTVISDNPVQDIRSVFDRLDGRRTAPDPLKRF